MTSGLNDSTNPTIPLPDVQLLSPKTQLSLSEVSSFRHYALREVGVVEIESEWTALDR